MTTEFDFHEAIETHLHEAEAYAANAANLFERAKVFNHLPTLGLCRDAEKKAKAAIKCFIDAMANRPASPIAVSLRFEGLEQLNECDWAFFDIEHAIRKLEKCAADGAPGLRRN